MRVHPIGPTLLERKIVAKGTAGRNWVLSHEGNAIHEIWQDKTMPVNRSGYLELTNNLDVKSFGVRPLRMKDWKFLPRALAEVAGLSLFGHNVYGSKRG